jgi:hypothetical protein
MGTADSAHPRMERERRTVEAMIEIYCQERHETKSGLCPECAMLADYARQRLQKCPFQEGKTTCAKCPVHCYKPDARQEIRGVMRYAGPRMLHRHPKMALWHLIDGRRQEPDRPEKARGRSAQEALRAPEGADR